jgi:CheY-like chemotaxis protein
MRTPPLILLVDDEEEFLEIASLKLRGKGFETFTTNDAHVALAKAEELQPDLILSDIYMVPGPNGWDLALELKRNPKTRDIKLVFFTSLRDPWIEIPTEAREVVVSKLGNPMFLSKIDDVDTLGEKIQVMLASL